jgi:mRNA interferase MazF
LKRGDLITIALGGDYGKPRPALVVQADIADRTDSVIVCMLTSHIAPVTPFRTLVESDVETGLSVDSDIMADKITVVLRSKCGPVFGHVSPAVMQRVNEALAFILALGE